jgi:hypothetical protein
MNVAVDRCPAMVESGSATGDLHRWPDVDGNARVFLAGDFDKTRRVGQEADTKAIVDDLGVCW